MLKGWTFGGAAQASSPSPLALSLSRAKRVGFRDSPNQAPGHSLTRGERARA